MRYPFVVLFRHNNYSNIDNFFLKNKDLLLCTVDIISDAKDLNKLYNSDYQILVTYGNDVNEYINECNHFISDRLRDKWIHYNELPDINIFNNNVNYCFISNCVKERENIRPIFSAFTTTYNSFGKILRAYDSLKLQKFKDWEWVIVDDSPDEKNFNFLKEKLLKDNRIRLYKRSKNSGNIGNVKNEAVSLCRGKYVIELDHDDVILPDVLSDSVRAFEENKNVGFIYMDFINLYENGDNFWYGNNVSKGYASYYCQKYNGSWVYVFNTADINNITLSHLTCCPNHPRIWRKETLLKAGNYCELLPICDDFEILLRTAAITKFAKINKLGYVQYMNNEGNNFSYIRNAEINRIGPQYIQPFYYEKFKIDEIMKNQNAFENESIERVWLKEEPYKYSNLIINYDYDKQYCIIGLECFIKNIKKIRELYENPRNDFLLLDKNYDNDFLFSKLVEYNLDRIKFFNLQFEENFTKEEVNKGIKNYFLLKYKSIKNYEIIE